MQWHLSSGLKLGAKKFRQPSDSYLQKVLDLKPVDCEIVHFVRNRNDIFDDISLTCDERLRRDQSKFRPKYILDDNLDIPDWNSLLKKSCEQRSPLALHFEHMVSGLSNSFFRIKSPTFLVEHSVTSPEPLL